MSIFPRSHAGRPPKYESPEDLQKAINDYFEDLQEDDPTLTGLALHLGFESRQSMYDYEKRDKFSYTIKRARLAIENKYESMLFKPSPTGAIFALKNFGWKDSVQHDVTESTRKALSDLDNLIRKQAQCE